MGYLVEAFLNSFFPLFLVIDVFGLVPIFHSLMKDFKKIDRIRNANRATYLASILLFLFLFFGDKILFIFGVSISSFKIAGGIIILILGLRIILGLKMVGEHISKYSMAAVPIATPLLVGAGVISTVIILVDQFGYIIPFIAAVINLLIVWLVLRYSEEILGRVGHQGTDIMSRIMGIILTALAVEFIRAGFGF